MSDSLSADRLKPRKAEPTEPMRVWVSAFAGGPARASAPQNLADLPGAVNRPSDAPKPMRVSNAQCQQMVIDCDSSWKKVKKTYMKDKVAMARLVEYRKYLVNFTIRDLDRGARGNLIAKAIGSDNLTSDYDITLSTANGDGSEIQAVRDFNIAIKAVFGVPPGVCFDTNLYVKDFLDVLDETILGSKAEPRLDAKPIDPVVEFLAMDRSDQDVGALTKQRQYMSVDQWVEYRGEVLGGLSGAGQEKAAAEAAVQFSEAESTYLLKAAEKVAAVLAMVRDSRRPDLLPEDKRAMTDFEAEWARDGDTERAHGLADRILALAQHAFEAEAMEANNKLYLDKMAEARRVQAEHKALEAWVALGEQPLRRDGTPYPDADSLTIAIDALKARAKKKITDANYFAAEAYLSEGPLQHIVSGAQGSKDKAKEAEIYAKLRPEHLLGSINEQFGDFMKDCSHYGKNEGEAFCQTSKYVERMLNGVIELRKKAGYDSFLPKAVTKERLVTMSAAIKATLLPIRGAKDIWADKDDEERFAEAALRGPGIYGVPNMKAVQGMAQRLVVEVNAFARAAISADGGMRADAEENREFFGNRVPQ